MVKQIVFFCLMFLSIAGFSQISKSDAQGFLSRNPIANSTRIAIYNLPDIVNNSTVTIWNVADIKSLSALESGFSLIIKYTDGDKEKFLPYGGVQSLLIAGDKSFVIGMRQ